MIDPKFPHKPEIRKPPPKPPKQVNDPIRISIDHEDNILELLNTNLNGKNINDFYIYFSSQDTYDAYETVEFRCDNMVDNPNYDIEYSHYLHDLKKYKTWKNYIYPAQYKDYEEKWKKWSDYCNEKNKLDTEKQESEDRELYLKLKERFENEND